MTTDEDRFEVPERLRRRVVPRRDGCLVTPVWELLPDAPGRARDIMTECLGWMYSGLERLGDPALVAEIESFFRGRAASPVAMACVLKGIEMSSGRAPASFDVLVDDLVARAGLELTTDTIGRLLPGRAPAWGSDHRLSLLWGSWWREAPARIALFDRLRTLLASAPDDQLSAARAPLIDLRQSGLGGRVLASYLLPSETSWVETDVADVLGAGETRLAYPLLGCVASRDQLDRLTEHVVDHSPWFYGGALPSLGTPMTIADGVGPTAAAALMHLYHEGNLRTRAHRVAIVDTLACMPTDEAFDLLSAYADDPVCRAGVRAAMTRFPRRSIVRLGRYDAPERRDLLVVATAAHPAEAEAVLGDLPAWAAGVVSAVLAAPDAAPLADAPAILVAPPWLAARRRSTVIEGLDRPDTVACTWLPRERERWLAHHRPLPAGRVEEALAQRDQPYMSSSVFRALADSDRDRVVEVLAHWRPDRLLFHGPIRWLVARHDTATHDVALDAVRRTARSLGWLVMPFESVAVVDLVTGWLKRRSLRRTALDWLRRHPHFAAEALVPVAVGRAGKARNDAGAALRVLVDLGHGTSVRAVASRLGEAVAAAVDEVLATDPVELVPARMPKLPAWISTALLPPVTTPTGAELPADALTNLILMLMISSPGEPYAGVERAAAGLDRSSLGAITCALYEQWRAAGAPTKDGWVIEALGAVGDDDMVEWVHDEIRRDTADPRALSLLDVFVTIGSDAALLALRRIAETVRTPRVRNGAEERTQAIADDLGLTADQLADRILPRLGLDDSGVLRLDYGPRVFEVRFDVQMKPVVHDAGGARRKDVPAPGANDDAAKASEAHAAFKRFKKDVRTHGVDQVKRLERAMVMSRRFGLVELRDVLLPHPLRRPVLQRLVWATFAGDGLTAACTGTFRIAEDGTFADVDDRAVELADDAVIGLAHPAIDGVAFDRWPEVFSDYELVQPFPQLARTWHTAEPTATASSELRDLPVKVDSRHFLSIERRGFDKPEVGDGGYLSHFVKQLANGRSFHLSIEPGVYMGDPTMEPQQSIVGAVLRAGPDDDNDPTFADIGAVATSEILVDLASLRS